MDAIVERCAGLDVHLDTVVACVLYGKLDININAWSLKDMFNVTDEEDKKCWSTIVENYSINEPARPFASEIINKLKKEGINKYELGRENFLKEAWKWKDEYADNIRKQWSKMGISLDYSKERFTLDEVSQKAVNYAFIKMYNDGLIYRGKKIINWDPEARTALSNEEVIYKDVEGAFYHLKYYIEGTNDYLDVATTRPETLFGDTAVAVNPKDERYNKLIGKNVILPIVGKLIPIIGDEHADMEFGTGVVKITPAHDPNDFEVGERHNLERIVVINKNGTMNENALSYKGMDRFACREKLVNDLKEQDLLIKEEKIIHSDRE